MSPSGKAPDFDSGIRRFKSGHPSQQKRHPQGCLFCWLGWAPVRTEPRMRRRCTFAARRSGSSLTRRRACESRSEAELPANLFISNIHRTLAGAFSAGWDGHPCEPSRECGVGAHSPLGDRGARSPGVERANHGAKRSYRPCRHTKPKLWTDLNQRSDNLPLVDKVYLLSLYISPNICYNIISSGAIIILEES